MAAKIRMDSWGNWQKCSGVCAKQRAENPWKSSKNVLTHEGAYNIIGECESVWKCQAKAPAKHFEDKKQIHLVVARIHECGRTSARRIGGTTERLWKGYLFIMRMIRQDGSYCGSDDHFGMDGWTAARKPGCKMEFTMKVRDFHSMDGHAARQSGRLSMM